MIQLTFTLQPENVRALCASIKAKGKGKKQTEMKRQYPMYASSTGEYVRQYEGLQAKIFGAPEMTRWAPLNDRPTTHYDPTQPIVSEEEC